MYKLYAKLSDIIGKTASHSNLSEQSDRLSEKEALEKSIETLKTDIVGCLPAFQK